MLLIAILYLCMQAGNIPDMVGPSMHDPWQPDRQAPPAGDTSSSMPASVAVGALCLLTGQKGVLPVAELNRGGAMSL